MANNADIRELSRDISAKRRKLDTEYSAPESNSDFGNSYNRCKREHRDYTVGWICALPLELAAATAMLDTIHERIPVSDDDSNTYTLGNIGLHNIVITCLPNGHYGTNNAASVSNNMSRSFPAIRIRLMVGIGGGAPGQSDIRLGDIVVSDGVVQYDFGKTIGDGEFKRTSTLTRPPQLLLTAAATLRADHVLNPPQISSIISEMLQRYPAMIKYHRPSPTQDILFDSTYDHVQSINGCESCEISQLVDRVQRIIHTEPQIYYGVVASGNQVIRHGPTRDRLASELNALCFEMEAAGLMDSFPCLVIRGICDYSDSHKSKEWQEYAAAAVAAYAKELLAVIPVNHPISKLKTDLVVMTDLNTVDQKNQFIESLKFEHIDSRRLNIRANHARTCQWLLAHQSYIDWLNPDKAIDHHGFLWIKGKPGAGKSTIMNFAYTQAINRNNTALSQTSNQQNIVLSFFYNARGEYLERSATGLYRSLLFQLLNAVPKTREVLDRPEHMVRMSGLQDALATNDALSERHICDLQLLLRSLITSCLDSTRLTIFVDALDECDEQEVEGMVQDFEELGESALSSGIHLTVCFSSRHYPHIQIEHGLELCLELQEGHEKDITTYIQSKLRIGKGKNADDVKAKMQNKADGIFMWIIIVVDILNAEYRNGRMFNVVKRLDALPSQLSNLFREILLRDQKNLGDLQLCVQWILFAKRPLKIEEYYFTIVSGLSPDDLCEWDPEGITKDDMKRFLLSSSKGLAEATKVKNSTVQFIHESVREFFLKDGLHELWTHVKITEFEAISHNQLRECCSSYLRFDFSKHIPKTLSKASSQESKDLRSLTLNKFPFLEYAIRHILYHANIAADNIPQEKFLHRFSLTAWIHLDNLIQIYDIRRHASTASFIYILAEWNYWRLLKTAMKLGWHPCIEGERYRYPLFAALTNGHEEAANTLLNLNQEQQMRDDVSIKLKYKNDFKIDNYHGPLSWATQHGSAMLVQSIIDMMPKFSFDPMKDWKTALSIASKNRYNNIIISLLAMVTSPVLIDTEGRTLSSYAAQDGNEGIMKLLITTGATLSTTDNIWDTHLFYKIKYFRDGALGQLLDAGADPGYLDMDGRTVLSYAAEHGNEVIVRRLLAATVKLNTVDNGGITSLIYATLNGHETVVKLLIAAKGINPYLGPFGMTALLFAGEHGYKHLVELLLASSPVNMDHKLTDVTQLFVSAKNIHKEIAEVLLDAGANSPKSAREYHTCMLLLAAERGYEGIVELLLATDEVELNTLSKERMTPLLYAIKNGHHGIVRLLLAKNEVHPDFSASYWDRPLSLAVRSGQIEVVQLLLNTNRVNPRGNRDITCSPLWLAVTHKHETITELLLASGELDMDYKAILDEISRSRPLVNGLHDISEQLQSLGGSED